jgi:hypothetical protein
MPQRSATPPGLVERLPQRLRPPASLSPGAREQFLNIVADERPEHFKPSDLPILCQYAEATAVAEHAARELWRSDQNTKWLTRWEKSIRCMSLLSLRLRLSPQARAPNNPKRQNLSYYERRALEEGADDAAE